jgi:hypothetical protein
LTRGSGGTGGRGDEELQPAGGRVRAGRGAGDGGHRPPARDPAPPTVIQLTPRRIASALGIPVRPTRAWRLRVLTVVLVLCGLAVLAGSGSPGFPLPAAATQLATTLTRTLTTPQRAQPAAQPAGTIADAATIPGIRASAAAIADIPSDYLGYYITAATTCPNLTWQLLAGIGKVESDHGRSPAPGVRAGLNRFGCCAGPMQFNLTNGPPSTWAGHARPGDSVYDPADAIPAAARKLCTDGLGPGAAAAAWAGKPGADPCPQVAGSPAQHRALRRYNNACWYAHQVLSVAARYTLRVGAPDPAADPFVRALAANPRITTTAARGCDPRADLVSGRLDVRVQSLLAAIAERHAIRVSCVAAGHSRYVRGTRRVSNHTVWRAIDIDRVDGQPVSRASPAARGLVAWLDRLDGPLRPAEIGSPFADYAPRPVFFTNAGHMHHIHIGYGSGWNDGVFTAVAD